MGSTKAVYVPVLEDNNNRMTTGGWMDIREQNREREKYKW